MSFENGKYNYQKYLQITMTISITSLLFVACKIHYDPPVNSAKEHYLVVEGYINTNGLTNIKLSRTRMISHGDTADIINETAARVVIEDNQNNLYPLNETGKGNYSAAYHLDSSYKYRLQIITAGDKKYVSDFVECKPSPPIDTINWSFKNGGVQLFANTHDPQNNTKFYRWKCLETWEFHSFYNSSLIWDDTLQKVVPRNEQVHICWRSQNSSGIFLGNSSKLSQDVISEAPLNYIPFGDNRISVLYSILVTQYTLDSAGYNYWSAMKGNTENMGSIFAAQPNQIKGNIHCTTDSSEIVIGYINAGTEQQQRIFINNSLMPSNWKQTPDCYITDVPKDSILYYLAGVLRVIPIDTILTPGTRFAYTAAFINCVDCTTYGSNVKPSFWP
jgi:hypothetical protein